MEVKKHKKVVRDLSKTRKVIDSRKDKVFDEEVKFNSGVMPSNSFRCNNCKEGFMIPPGYPIQCPHCDSHDLRPHAEVFAG